MLQNKHRNDLSLLQFTEDNKHLQINSQSKSATHLFVERRNSCNELDRNPNLPQREEFVCLAAEHNVLYIHPNTHCDGEMNSPRRPTAPNTVTKLFQG